jgi:hypothetical protein
MSPGYIAHLKGALRRESEKELDLYKKDKFAFIEGAFTKRVRELEDNQEILRRIIANNPNDPNAQVKAVLALNETIVLIANLFQMLPNMHGLGMDAFTSSSSSSNNNNNNSTLLDTEEVEVEGQQKKGKEKEKEDLKPEWSV